MEDTTFFARQDYLRRLTVLLLVLTAIGSIGTACLGGLVSGIVHLQLELRQVGVVDPVGLHRAIAIGAYVSFAITTLVVFVQLVLLRYSPGASRRFFQARDLSAESHHSPLSQADEQLVNVVEEMALASGLPRPRIYLLDEDPSINSFALSLGVKLPIVGVTAGAISALSRDELQAMIAHEIAHIGNGDAAINIRLLALIRGFRWFYDFGVAVIGFPVRAFGWSKVAVMFLFYLAMAFGVFVGVGLFGLAISRVMHAAIARQREYLADASAMQFTRNETGLLGALAKAGQFQQGKKSRPTHAAAFMMFVSPYRARSWLLRTHPTIEQRIAAVDAMAPGQRSAVSVANWG